MAVICIDQTETGLTTFLTRAAGGGSGVVDATNTGGAWSEYSLACTNVDEGHYFDEWATEIYGQCRIYAAASSSPALRFRSPNGTQHLAIGLSAGVFQSSIAAGSYSSTKVWETDRWYYLQFRLSIHDSTGIYVLKVDGETVLNLSNVDTRSDSGTNGQYVSNMGLVGSNSFPVYFDDWIINDTTGTDNVSYPDNLGVEGLRPQSNGDDVELTPYPGTAARWYFPNTADLVGVDPDPEWEKTSQALNGFQFLLAPVPGGGAASTTTPSITESYSANQDYLLAQYVSPPLAAQSISGTFKCYQRARQGSNDVRSQIIIRVVSNDGSTEEAVLYAGDLATTGPNPTSEWAGSSTNRGFPRAGLLPASLSTYSCADGDRVVVELGFRGHGGGAAGANDTINIGATDSSDLAENETATGAARGWIEFSSALTLSDAGNYEYVDEIPADDDDTYVYGDTVGQRDLYEYPQTQWTEVAAVALSLQVKKEDIAEQYVAHAIKYDSDDDDVADTEDVGENFGLSTGSWVQVTKIWNRQPDNTSWSEDKVNAVQAGPAVE